MIDSFVFFLKEASLSTSISSILVNGTTVEGMTEVHSAVFDNFADHFKARIVERRLVDDLQFHMLS